MNKCLGSLDECVHGRYRCAPYMKPAEWYLHIHKVEHDNGNPLSHEDCRSYYVTLQELSKASQKRRDAARKVREFKEAEKWQKRIWIQRDPVSGLFGGGSIKWKNLGLDERIKKGSLRAKYHRMPGTKDIIPFIIQTEGKRLVNKATIAKVSVEEMAHRLKKTLRANEIVTFHEGSGFWHGVDWDTASLAKVERNDCDELTEIQQGFRDKYGNLPKGYFDCGKPEESSWLKSIKDLVGCTTNEAIEIHGRLYGCSRIPEKLPVRKLAKRWHCGFNWVDPAIAKAKADKLAVEQAERERVENELRIKAEQGERERVEAETAKTAKIKADRERKAKIESERIAAEIAGMRLTTDEPSFLSNFARICNVTQSVEAFKILLSETREAGLWKSERGMFAGKKHWDAVAKYTKAA